MLFGARPHRGEVGRRQRDGRGARVGGREHGGGGGGQRGRRVPPQRPHLPQRRAQRARRARTRLLHHVRVVRHCTTNAMLPTARLSQSTSRQE